MARSRFASIVAACVCALALSLSACGGGGSTKGTGDGTVTGISADGRQVTLDHGEIPGVMGPMVMSFTVTDPKILEGVEPGAQVSFDVEVRGGEYFVTGVRKR